MNMQEDESGGDTEMVVVGVRAPVPRRADGSCSGSDAETSDFEVLLEGTGESNSLSEDSSASSSGDEDDEGGDGGGERDKSDPAVMDVPVAAAEPRASAPGEIPIALPVGEKPDGADVAPDGRVLRGSIAHDTGGEGGKGTCAICLSDLAREVGVLDVCLHRFCYTCIRRWKKERNTCPVCGRRFHRLSRLVNSRIVGHLTVAADYDNVSKNDKHYFFGHTVCQVCGYGDYESVLLICDVCELGNHTFCIDLPEVPDCDKWLCPRCVAKNEQGQLEAPVFLPPDVLAGKGGESTPLPTARRPAVVPGVPVALHAAGAISTTRPPPPMRDLTKRKAYIERLSEERRLRKVVREDRRKEKIERKVVREAGRRIVAAKKTNTNVTRESMGELRRHLAVLKSRIRKMEEKQKTREIATEEQKRLLKIRIQNIGREPSRSKDQPMVSRPAGAPSSVGRGAVDDLLNSWTAEQDSRLLRAVQMYGKDDWRRVSGVVCRSSHSVLSYRSPPECQARFLELTASASPKPTFPKPSTGADHGAAWDIRGGLDQAIRGYVDTLNSARSDGFVAKFVPPAGGYPGRIALPQLGRSPAPLLLSSPAD